MFRDGPPSPTIRPDAFIIAISAADSDPESITAVMRPPPPRRCVQPRPA